MRICLTTHLMVHDAKQYSTISCGNVFQKGEIELTVSLTLHIYDHIHVRWQLLQSAAVVSLQPVMQIGISRQVQQLFD